MSYIVDGAHGQDWQGANWVFYNMSEHLLPVLRKMEGGEALAEKLIEALNVQIGYIDLADLLESPKISAVWVAAIDETVARIRAEGNKGWREPDRFEPFLEKIAELKSLALIQQPA